MPQAMPVSAARLVCRDPRWRRADRDVAFSAEGLSEGGERGCLAGAGVADHADHAVATLRDGSYHRRLFPVERHVRLVDYSLDRRRPTRAQRVAGDRS